jgi:two-component system sensor kinase FixL
MTNETEGPDHSSCRPAASAAHFRKMYDRISGLAKIGVWECDLATEKLTWTDMVYDPFEIPRGTAIERAEIVRLYEPNSRREMEKLRSEAIAGGTGFTLDVRIRTASGNDKWIRLTADIEREDGRSVRIFGTKQDITAERAAQDKVQTLQTELIHVSRISAMGAMASTLAHEINQPLAAASNYLAAARRMAAAGKVTPDLSDSIEAAVESTLRAGEIIRRVRDMSAKGHVFRADLELEPVVREAVELATAGNPDVVVAWDLEPDAAVKADRIQIQQVIINLVRNACESAAGGPVQVAIRSRITGSHLEICVTDNGPGIADDVLADVFESFVTTKPDGLGMGLSISRTIVEAHGGGIRAANLDGRGACFSFTLPLAGGRGERAALIRSGPAMPAAG